MALLVQKYGGSSVKDLDAIRHVASRIQKSIEAGHQVVIVLSAMQGETDRLLKLALSLTDQPSSRELNALVATGEQASTALLALALENLGLRARSYNALQIGIQAEGHAQSATISGIQCQTLMTNLSQGIISIVTGFQGSNTDGDLLTLGRGGSDITAVALAAALKADECQIFTDVKGVYSADPRIISKAQLISHIPFNAMLEMAGLGAKVLHARSVDLAYTHEVPLRVASTFHEEEGTLIHHTHEPIEHMRMIGLTCEKNQALCTIENMPVGTHWMVDTLNMMAKAHFEIHTLVHSKHSQQTQQNISFTLEQEQSLTLKALLDLHFNDHKDISITLKKNMAKVSLIGTGLNQQTGLVAKILSTLESKGIPVDLIATTEMKISLIILANQIADASQILIHLFDLHHQKASEQAIYLAK